MSHGWKHANDHSHEAMRKRLHTNHDDEDAELFASPPSPSTSSVQVPLSFPRLDRIVKALSLEGYYNLEDLEADRLRARMGCRWVNTYMTHVVREYEERLKEHHRASIILRSQGKALKAMEDLTTRLLRVKDLAELKDGEMAMAMAIAWDYEARKKMEEKAPMPTPLVEQQAEWVSLGWTKFGEKSPRGKLAPFMYSRGRSLLFYQGS